MYLTISPDAVLAAIGLARIAGASRAPKSIGWCSGGLAIGVVQPALNGPRPVAIVPATTCMPRKWLRAQEARMRRYLVADAVTAYCLQHLAVLGNPRASERLRKLIV